MNKSILIAGLALAGGATNAAYAQIAASPPAGPPSYHAMQMPATRAELQAQVRARFVALDRNKDGYVSRDELRMGQSHPPRPEGPDAKNGPDRLFAMMDKDGNGQISKAEFDAFHAEHGSRWAHADHGQASDGGRGERIAMMHGGRGFPRRMPEGRRMAAIMFHRADANHDGKVSLAEAEAAATARFDKVDTNHDGTLSDAEREAAHDAMKTRFAERMHRDDHSWDHGRNWDHKGDTPPPPVAAPGAGQGTNTQ